MFGKYRSPFAPFTLDPPPYGQTDLSDLYATILKSMRSPMPTPRGPQYRSPPQVSFPPVLREPESSVPSFNFGPLAGSQTYPQWQPTNEAAKLIDSGTYADPLLRQAATWNVPNFGSGGFGGGFGNFFSNMLPWNW